MKRNVTLTAEGGLIEAARRKAAAEGTTLNKLFRSWVSAYAAGDALGQDYQELMDELDHVTAGRAFSRDEMNER